MRIRLYLDPEQIEKYLIQSDFPTIRQVLEEIYSTGNVNIILFSERSLDYINSFIYNNYLDGLIYRIQPTLKIYDPTDGDIIADTREEILEQSNHISIINGYKPLLKWLCPNSKLLDDSWCLINSKFFIETVDDILAYLLTNNKKIPNEFGDLIDPEYLRVEKILVMLYNILKSTPEMVKTQYHGFSIVRKDNKYSFHYEDNNGV